MPKLKKKRSWGNAEDPSPVFPLRLPVAVRSLIEQAVALSDGQFASLAHFIRYAAETNAAHIVNAAGRRKPSPIKEVSE